MLVSRPGDPSRLALRATYGLLLSTDGGNDWDWVCERAVGYGGNEDPSLAITGSGVIVVGTFEGTMRSTDGGCHWSANSDWPSSVIDLTTRPTATDHVYALTSRYEAMGDAGASYRSELYVSNDAGAHWSSRSIVDAALLVDSIEVAPSDPNRAYISAVRTRAHESEGVLLRSNDDGAHWEEHRFPIARADRGIYIAAIDLKNPDRVYLRASSVDASELFVTSDGGKTAQAIFHGGPLPGFALANAGQTIFAGGPKDGLLRASVGDLHFETVTHTPIQCLTAIGEALWNCAPTTEGYVLGASNDRGAHFSPRLTLTGMRGPLKCESPSAMGVCAQEWSALQSTITRDSSSDASSTAPAARATSAKRSTFGCTIHREKSGDSAAPLSLLVLVAWTLRLRVWRRRRSGYS